MYQFITQLDYFGVSPIRPQVQCKQPLLGHVDVDPGTTRYNFWIMSSVRGSPPRNHQIPLVHWTTLDYELGQRKVFRFFEFENHSTYWQCEGWWLLVESCKATAWMNRALFHPSTGIVPLLYCFIPDTRYYCANLILLCSSSIVPLTVILFYTSLILVCHSNTTLCQSLGAPANAKTLFFYNLQQLWQ